MTETVPTQPTPPNDKPARSKGHRILVGVGIGCGVLGLLFFIAIGGAIYWLYSTGPQSATAAVVGPRSAGVIHISHLGDSEPVRELLGEVLQVVIENGDYSALGPLGGLAQRFQSAQIKASSTQFIPSEITVSIEANGDGGDLVFATALNPSFAVRPFRRMLSATLESQREQGAEVPTLEHRDQLLLEFGRDSGRYAGFVGGTFLITTKPLAVEQIDRLLDEPGAELDSARLAALPQREESWLIAAVLDPEAVSAAKLEGLAAPDRIERLSLGMTLTTVDTLEGAIRADCPDDADAEAIAQQLEASLAGLAEGLSGMTLTSEVTRDGSRVLAPFELTGVRDALKTLVRTRLSGGR